MAELARIGVAIESDLLEAFDQLISQRGYPSRSEAFRDLIREALSEESIQQPGAPVLGTLTLIYDHHQRLLGEKLAEIQHEHHESIVSTLHVHLDHDNCLEVLVLRGLAGDVKRLADRLVAAKGVKQGRLTLAAGQGGRAHSHPH
jgi:CopG family nickel-responsive transcriptional regulator